MQQKKYEPILISRYHEYELEDAIKDLEARGFVLLQRGEKVDEYRDYKYQNSNRVTKRKFDGIEVEKNYWARMQKKA